MMQILQRQPRQNSHVKIHYHNIDIYKAYCIHTGNPHKLSQLQYFRIFNEYIDYINLKIVTEGFLFSMPYRLGKIGVYKTKIVYKIDNKGYIDKKGLRIDWNSTVKLWGDLYPNKSMSEIKLIKNKPLLYFINKNTDGYNLRFAWDKSSSNAVNQFMYRFKPVRNLARYLSSHTKDGTYKNDYALNTYRVKTV